MQDEACTTYGADVEQMTLGHQFLLENFGAVPIRGWQIGTYLISPTSPLTLYLSSCSASPSYANIQIDPFGQSTVTATLEKLAGFKSHLIDRTTYKVSNARRDEEETSAREDKRGVGGAGEYRIILTFILSRNINKRRSYSSTGTAPPAWARRR